MKKRNSIFWPIGACLSGIGFILIMAGCNGVVGGGEEPDQEYYECSIQVLKCKKTQNNVPNYVTIYQPATSGSCYAEQKNLQVNDKVYCESNLSWVVNSINYEKLRGARWIMTRYGDRLSQANPLLNFKIIESVEGVYLAYDSRATTKPLWLTSNYTKVIGPGSKPVTIEITKTDDASNKLSLEIYRYNGSVAVSAKVPIPGNFYQNPAWPPGFNTDNAAMYMVIVKPVESDDCSQSDVLTTLPLENCYDDMTAAENAMKKECEEYVKSHSTTYKLTCGTPVCYSDKACANKQALSANYGLTLDRKAVPSNAEVEFDPKKYASTAKIDVVGKQYTRNVTGTARLQYVLNGIGQMERINVLTMTLKVDAVNTDIGNFTDISFALLSQVTAKCQDTYPPYHQPCSAYQIPVGAFISALNVKLDGKPLLYTGNNKKLPLNLKIDQVKRTFGITGGLNTTITVDGESKPVSISINLTGHFVNFTPTAVGIESDKQAECAEKMNQTDLVLRSAGSFDIYDPLPSNPPSYKWYEDYGLVSEKYWGDGSKFTIPAYQLDFGVHHFTLVVKDKNGTVDTDTVRVVVRDTQPPDLYVPQDIYMVVMPPYPASVKVDIGEASGVDACSDQVMIFDDAPAGLLFKAGVLTPVTWTADDGRGNLTKKVQDICLFVLEVPFNPKRYIAYLKDIIVPLNQSIEKSKKAIEECGPEKRCPLELHPLIGVLKQLTEIAGRLEVPEDQQHGKRELMERIQPIFRSMEEAQIALFRSQEGGGQFMELRERAVQLMSNAQQMMRSIAEMPPDALFRKGEPRR